MGSRRLTNSRYDFDFRAKELSLDIPVKFADTEEQRALFGAPFPKGLKLSYLWQPPKSGASWFPERYRLTPDFDLSRYTARAEVDYIRIGFTAAGYLNRARLSTRLREAIGVPVSIEPTARGGSGHTHTAKIQQPNRMLAETLIKLLGEQEGLSCTGAIEEIEISVDWYANDESDTDRWLMTELLWRHLLPDAKYWRHQGGFPRCSWGGSKETRHLLYMSSEEAQPAAAEQPVRYGVPLGLDPIRDAALELRNYRQPKANGTIYYGARDVAAMAGDHLGVSFRIMHKVIDNQNRVSGTRTVLDKEERRTRMEITLRGPALDELRVSGPDDLPAAIKQIRKRFFRFYIPTMVYAGPLPDNVEQLAQAIRLPRYETAFRKAGVFGLAMYQWAEKEQRRAFNRRAHKYEMDLIDHSMLPLAPEDRFNKFTALNERARKTLDRLSKCWERQAGAPMDHA